MVRSYRPQKLAEALAIRAENSALPLAGSTDLLVRHRAKNGLAPPLDGPILFLDRIDEFLEIHEDESALTIGAMVSMALLAGDPIERQRQASSVNKIPSLLQKSAAELAAPALRQRATLGGNIANASPAGDTLVPLYVLNAAVNLVSLRGRRCVPLCDFIRGPGKTILDDDELIQSVTVPKPFPRWGYWRKVGTRKANALTKVSLAASAEERGGVINQFSLALGAVGPTVLRVQEIESLLEGKTVLELRDSLVAQKLCDALSPFIRPIDDQRSTAHYRKTIALNLAGEALTQLSQFFKESL